MNYAYIICRKCGYRIGTVFECWCDAPIHFVVTCPKCGYRGVYSYASLIADKKCEEKCKKVAELRERFYTATGLSLLADALSTIMVNIKQMLTTEEQKEENKKQ
jgi:predicted nucleic-acid-binding Zn-ribbon protein